MPSGTMRWDGRDIPIVCGQCRVAAWRAFGLLSCLIIACIEQNRLGLTELEIQFKPFGEAFDLVFMERRCKIDDSPQFSPGSINVTRNETSPSPLVFYDRSDS